MFKPFIVQTAYRNRPQASGLRCHRLLVAISAGLPERKRMMRSHRTLVVAPSGGGDLRHDAAQWAPPV